MKSQCLRTPQNQAFYGTPSSFKMAAQLQQFFKSHDSDGSRSVDVEAFRDLCSRLNISSEDADVIFEDLDHDRDGRISFGDFSRGFSNFMSATDEQDGGVQEMEARPGDEEATKHHVWTTLTSEAERVGKRSSDEGKLKWLLSELQASEQRHLVPYLESAVDELLGSLQQLQEEKARLEESWQREKQEHSKHLKRMEEELDNQVKEAELKMRIKAQEEVEDERKSLQSRMDSELDKLQTHLKLVEKVYAWLRTQPAEAGRSEARLEEVRAKLEEAARDNRQLRLSLLDTQTSIALMRGELVQLRALYEEKCRELSSEREKILEVLQEQDHLTRQLNLLHDANKRLLDSQDALRCSVESPMKQVPSSIKRCRSGSIIGEYLDIGYHHDILSRFEEDDDDDSSDNRRPKSMDSTCVVRRRPKARERDATRQSLNHSDSGVSTVRDSAGEGEEPWRQLSPDTAADEDEDEEEPAGRRERFRRPSGQSRRGSSVPPSDHFRMCEYPRREEVGELRTSNSQDSILSTDTLPRKRISDIKKQLGIEDTPLRSWNTSWSPSPVKCSTPRERSIANASPSRNVVPPIPMPRLSKINSIYESIDTDDFKSDATYSELQQTVSVEEDDGHFEPTGPPEHTFKVIFVGDAGVGKSSFALRVSKGVFVRHMSSTLGLDFLMRSLRVDGKNVAVQLWDTAGQERFRSITKSYFRKADGVMLLYDCTCEHSFLNVRQWVDDIDEACFYSMMAENPATGRKVSNKRMPLMIVANKIDLRDVATKSGSNCITKEQGQKLAKSCDTTFMEASAKEGSNVLNALANLVRSMSTHLDLQMTGSTMQLCDVKQKKSSCCGK